MKHAETSTTKVYSTTYDWSPALTKMINTVRYWELCLRKSKGHLVSPFRLKNLQVASEIDLNKLPTLLTLSRIVNLLRDARSQLKDHKKNYETLHQNHVVSLAEARIEKRSPHLFHPSNLAKLEKAIEKKSTL